MCSKPAGTCYQPRMQLLVHNNSVYSSFSIIVSTDSKARSSWMWQLETIKMCPLRNVVIWVPQLTCTYEYHSHGYWKTVFWRGLFFWASTQLRFTLRYILGHTLFPLLPAWYILAYLNYLLCEVQRFWGLLFFFSPEERSTAFSNWSKANLKIKPSENSSLTLALVKYNKQPYPSQPSKRPNNSTFLL